MSTDLLFHVAGVTFAAGYPDTIYRLIDLCDVADAAGEPMVAILIRDHRNQHDPNAIQVHVPALGQMIGCVPSDRAAQMAPQVDGGLRYRAEVSSAGTVRSRVDRPGVSIRVALVEQGPAA